MTKLWFHFSVKFLLPGKFSEVHYRYRRAYEECRSQNSENEKVRVAALMNHQKIVEQMNENRQSKDFQKCKSRLLSPDRNQSCKQERRGDLEQKNRKEADESRLVEICGKIFYFGIGENNEKYLGQAEKKSQSESGPDQHFSRCRKPIPDYEFERPIFQALFNENRKRAKSS